MSRSGNASAPEIVAVMGGTGSGKTTQVRKVLHAKRRARTVIWSPKESEDRFADDYPGSVVVRSASECLNVLMTAGGGGVHVVFQPALERKADEAMFSAVCRQVLAARNLTMVVDELHTVTRPSWAPDGWRKLVMMGRAYGCAVIGASQRPASIDKDFLGNCSRIHVRRLAHSGDVQACALALDVPPERVRALVGYQWLERNMITGKVTSG